MERAVGPSSCLPGALPQAGMWRAVGADLSNHRSLDLKGQRPVFIPAQGKVLGVTVYIALGLKVRSIYFPSR